MFHVFAAVVCLGASLASGAQIVLPHPQGYRGEASSTTSGSLIERHKVTFLITVPTAISALMQRPVNADISSLKLGLLRLRAASRRALQPLRAGPRASPSSRATA
jgi:acyl-coenzyme A synthetase/AMP-(fatty) acid ligase